MSAKWEDHKDKSRDEIMAMADKAISDFRARGWPATYVHFKFTCEKCGERCTFAEPNMLYERGTCFECGHETTITKAGFSLYAAMNE